jgi:hypothetical protein
MKERAAIAAEAANSYSEPKCDQLFQRLKTNGNWQVPTLTLLRSFGFLNDPQFRQNRRLRYFIKDFRDWLNPKDDFTPGPFVSCVREECNSASRFALF